MSATSTILTEDLSALTLADFLSRVADRTPTPGGGSVTGVAGALGCALASMVAAYSVRRDTDPGAREVIEHSGLQLRRCEQILQALVTQDAVAYEKLNAAGKARRESPGNPAVEGEYAQAVFEAIAVPMEMAAVASNALAAIDGFKHVANRFLLSDLAIAASLANLTASAARSTIQANAREITDKQPSPFQISDAPRQSRIKGGGAPRQSRLETGDPPSRRESLLADIDRILLHCASRHSSIDAFIVRNLSDSD